jgi:hypothetical protein
MNQQDATAHYAIEHLLPSARHPMLIKSQLSAPEHTR